MRRPVESRRPRRTTWYPCSCCYSAHSSGTSHEQRTSFRDEICSLSQRSPSPGPNRFNQSSAFHSKCHMLTPERSTTTTTFPPYQTEYRFPTNGVGTQQEPADIGPSVSVYRCQFHWHLVDPTAIGRRCTKTFLQIGATAFKLVPIANLDRIPNTLLAWIKI
ncbi:uncharacterized protein EI90DRAFT_2466530 [Cantharellus anzutake]|uniref:uncharacterized protein n=1 Tax=Cantharellus anzutake TaxID=1750568 RepID=UPI001904FAB0|nr:uncharacterized protein EI90DRAFT_2466530 [Cantharellus anzutake]KAF8339156.1 hypothetical protein EI90DRAFT_2466530 [Cantharellus anzutake]